MANTHGDWVWYELITPDADGAQAFYSAVLDWKIANPANDGFDYREIQAADGDYIGGILQMAPEMAGPQPGWVGYIAVDDVDASITRIEKAGGKLCMPARDLEGVGRFAMISDPQGALFYIMKSTTGDTSAAFIGDRAAPGHCAWNELSTTDPAGAMAFYTQQFDWAKDGEMDMGPMGAYEFLVHGGPIGALMQKVPEDPVSHWLHYFRVNSIDAAVASVSKLGGHITQQPQQVPGDEWVIQGKDPQGAWFALVGTK